MNNPASLLGSYVEELLRNIVNEAVAEALLNNAEDTPRYPEKVGVDLASEITGYTKNRLYQMHSKGQVPGALKVGGKLMFDTKILKRWVDEGGRRIPPKCA